MGQTHGLTGLATIGKAVTSMSLFTADASLHRDAAWEAAHLIWLCLACTLPGWSISFSWAGREVVRSAVKAIMRRLPSSWPLTAADICEVVWCGPA